MVFKVFICFFLLLGEMIQFDYILPGSLTARPLKSYRNPKGKAKLPFPPFFTGELLSFGGVIFLLVGLKASTSNSVYPLEVKDHKMTFSRIC